MADFLHLRKSENFTKCIKTGVRINTKYYTLYLLDNHERSVRLGISVSKKVSKLSVVRNFIKRQIRS
ncbi:ribonuclease P protein component [bacterium]|nr:ribonuclease P protein component [bacterium]MBP5783664.1 ribonuclease P protein component [bacterium]